jgi:hypothetical protein
MAAVANNPKFAKKAGVPKSVGEEFMKADTKKPMKMAAGGMPMVEKDGKSVPAFAADGVGKMAKGGMACSPSAMKKTAKTEVKGHEKKMHGMAKGGVAKMVTKEMEYDYKTGKKSFSGSTAKKDAHAEKEGKRVAKDLAYDKAKKMAKGGGCEVRGKTKGTMIKMKKGGAC